MTIITMWVYITSSVMIGSLSFGECDAMVRARGTGGCYQELHYLDQIGRSFGVQRHYGESDRELRERILMGTGRDWILP